MTSTSEADPRLVGATDLALAALREITAPETIGAPAGHAVADDGVVSLSFENTMPGYPNWFWTVSLAVVEGSEPTVLEAELLPGDGAILAPEWVPWSQRLEEYKAAQAAAAEAAAHDAEADADDDEVEDDYDDDDESDEDEGDAPILHAGDLDGVDIDELDDSAGDHDDEDDEGDESEDDDASEDGERDS
ncbi:DUF3027 domain-containing protein [Microbacterium indicum]|uniref:DUF3027 domain-containing protein n=1 Tax=Microbacterium indicum TaxID=358100 RepID=UPI00048C46F0|nr:DUF3027 domain-containing protein [Microbacterium indicum]